MATMQWGAMAPPAGTPLGAGCDQSKAALAATPRERTAALAERDAYKQPLDTARAQLDAAQTRVALVKAAAAASPPVAGAMATGAAGGEDASPPPPKD